MTKIQSVKPKDTHLTPQWINRAQAGINRELTRSGRWWKATEAGVSNQQLCSVQRGIPMFQNQLIFLIFSLN